MKFIIILTLMIISASHIYSQYTKTASCADPAFDKKVNSYLSYSVPVINVKDAFKDKAKYIFLDAREIDEFQVSHIPDARYIGYDDFKINNVSDISKESKIIVYCSIGYRSEKIATKLKKAGYKNVYNLYGSIFEWVNSGLEVNDRSGNVTKKIHTYNKKWSQWVNYKTAEKIW